MFRRKKEEADEAPPATETAAAPAAPSSLIKPQAPGERMPPAAPIRPEPARPAYAAATPSAPPATKPESPPAASAADEAQQLIVGRGIVLNGEITACDRLVVEGRIEATLSRTRSVEIAPSGAFKGAAEIEQATVAGVYEGKLTCRGKLTIRGTGRVLGEVRYGEIEIEPGGVICGSVGATTG